MVLPYGGIIIPHGGYRLRYDRVAAIRGKRRPKGAIWGGTIGAIGALGDLPDLSWSSLSYSPYCMSVISLMLRV